MVSTKLDCPNCKGDNFLMVSYYKSGEENNFCSDCGYKSSFLYKKDLDGNYLRKDESKDFDVDNLIAEEIIHLNPFGAFSIEYIDGLLSCGTLVDKKDYDVFVSDIFSFVNQPINITKAEVSRYVDGNIVKEVIFENK